MSLLSRLGRQIKQSSFWFRKCPADGHPLRYIPFKQAVRYALTSDLPSDYDPMELYVCDKCGAHYTPMEVLT